jgi:hypothetical protein
MDSLKPHRFNLDVEDKYFYDEKKKRFVNYPNIPLIYLQQFRYNHFKTVIHFTISLFQETKSFDLILAKT